MQMVEIVSNNKNWYCKTCQRGHDNLFFITSGESYCSKCVPSELKDKFKKVDQNGKEIQ